MLSGRTTLELEQQIQSFAPDILFTLGTPAYFSEELLTYVGNRKHPDTIYIHWDTDGITWKEIELRHIQRLKPDFVFTICPEMQQVVIKLRIPTYMLLYAYSPMFHHPAPQTLSIAGQITFTGSAYIEILKRQPPHYRRISMDTLFAPLLQHGKRIDFYGDDNHGPLMYEFYQVNVPNEWLHGRVPYLKTFEIYNSSLVNLIAQNHPYTLTKRLFEVMGCGGFALAYENTAIREVFQPGKDVATARTPAQTLEILEYYTKNPEAYKNIRENALASSLNHTYKQRAQQILFHIPK